MLHRQPFLAQALFREPAVDACSARADWPFIAWRRDEMALPITQFSPYTSLFSFVIGLPTMIGAYYQSWKARQEARLAREGAMASANCLEFVVDDGTCVNLVPLETLHSLPKPGDIVLLPGDG